MKFNTIVLLIILITLKLTSSHKQQKKPGDIKYITRNVWKGKILLGKRTYDADNEFPNPITPLHIKGNENQFGSQQPGSPYPGETNEPNPNGPPLFDEICHNMTSHETTQESDVEEGSPESTIELSGQPGTEKPSDESYAEDSGSPGVMAECEKEQNDLTSAGEEDGNDSNKENLLESCERSRGQFPSKSSCKSFINCWDGSAYEQNCPAGLYFSKEGFCDYPYNVDCGNRPTQDVKPKSCETPFSVYRSPTNCSEFFVCVHGCPVKFVCPDQLQFNEDLGVCDYKYRVGCVEDGNKWKGRVHYYNQV